MKARFVMITAFSTFLAATGTAQQAAAPAAQPGPNTGDAAPAFTGKGADKSGTLAKAISLADLKGKTVVLAFFPAARTSGCTTQMTGYRDQYEKLFMGGKNVVLLGISTDADTTLHNWAKEANFPFQFVSDDGSIGRAYGTLDDSRKTERRFVYVISPDGKISYVKKPFSPNTPPQYEELGAEVHKAMGSHHE
ncbi:MAG TPA: redoxin domain-containing protein [Gemmatimonadaceae bacterium]|nr:redoxin domain-containing protein [Gemmatimonadaceae bacterium]